MGLPISDYAAAPKQRLTASLASIATQVAGRWCSLWRATGIPLQGAIPATGAGNVPTDVDSGLIFVNPTAPAKTALGRLVVATGNAAGQALLIYDRLVTNSGMSGIVTTAQSGPTGTIPRGDTTGADCSAWLEWYTATGATGVTATISYTDGGGTAGRTTTVAVPATTGASQMLEIPPAAGAAPGFRSIQSVTLSATTGTAGNFGVTIGRRIFEALIPPSYTPAIYEIESLGGPRIDDDTCFAFAVLPTTTSSGAFTATLTLAQASTVV